MVSINNVSGNSAVLASLRKINSDLSTTQTRIGNKVNSASDNSAVWTMAQGIRSDIKGQDSLAGNIAVAKGKADTAVAALDTVNKLMGSIKELADDATSNPPASYTSVIAKITALQAQIASVVSGSSFQGDNYLDPTTPGATSVNIGVSGGVAQTLSVTTIDVTADTAYVAAIAAPTDKTTVEALAGPTGLVATAQAALTTYQSTLSGFSSSLEVQGDFLASLKSIRETALSSLVDANLEEESAKVTSLQVKQQLAYQALSIGNSSAQNILQLFQ
jgi:flagellin